MSRYGDDAWIFVSIGDAVGWRGWASLTSLIRAADSRNHAIPTIAELEGAVSRLAAARLVETRGSDTRLTDAGKRAFKEAEHPRVGHIERMFRLSQLWEAQRYPPEAPVVWSVAQSAFDAAYAEYRS